MYLELRGVDGEAEPSPGGADNDSLLGNRGNDVALGQDRNDLLIVNNGDGSDFLEQSSPKPPEDVAMDEASPGDPSAKIELKNVLVTSYDVHGAVRSASGSIEDFSLNFEEIKFVHDGGADTMVFEAATGETDARGEWIELYNNGRATADTDHDRSNDFLSTDGGARASSDASGLEVIVSAATTETAPPHDAPAPETPGDFDVF
jgi:hypothetical protein